MSTGNHLLYFSGQVLCRVNPQNNQQKHTTKTFAKFPRYFPQLTMNKPRLMPSQVKRAPQDYINNYLSILKTRWLFQEYSFNIEVINIEVINSLLHRYRETVAGSIFK